MKEVKSQATSDYYWDYIKNFYTDKNKINNPIEKYAEDRPLTEEKHFWWINLEKDAQTH